MVLIKKALPKPLKWNQHRYFINMYLKACPYRPKVWYIFILNPFFTFGPPFSGTEKAPTGTGVGRGSVKGAEVGSSWDSWEPYGTLRGILLQILLHHLLFTLHINHKFINLFSNSKSFATWTKSQIIFWTFKKNCNRMWLWPCNHNGA